MNKILDKLPSGPIILFGTLFALMPFFPQPHLVEKAMMLIDGTALKPIDWFDIFWHGGAGALALAKFLRDRQLHAQGVLGSDHDTDEDQKD